MARPHCIGLVFSYSLAYCRAILRGVKQFAAAQPDWVFASVDPDPAGLRRLAQLEPAGVIAHVFERRICQRLQALQRPLVNVCGVVPFESLPRVGVDDDLVGRLAADHLIERGLRRFAFVGQPNHGYSVRREQGFGARLAELGLRFQAYEERGAFDPRGRLWSLDDRLRSWLATLPKPVGVFACNDAWGVQLTEACRRLGLSIPDEVAVLGVDNDDLLCELSRPSLSSVALPAEAVGQAAAALLERLLRGRRPPRAPLLLPPVGVVVRHSSEILAIEDQAVAEVVARIRQASGRLSAKLVTRGLPLSRRSLERRFRQSLGRGIGQEVRRAQLQRAQELLATTEWTMDQIAQAAGFTDGRHVAVAFRKNLQTTPSEYRRRFRLPPAVRPRPLVAGQNVSRVI
jgi:LacI family transcriptional regulator